MPVEIFDKFNRGLYLKVFREVSENPNIKFSDEKDWYKQKLKSYSRSESIRKFCSFCTQEVFSDKDSVPCEMRWGQEYNNQNPEGCPFNMWRLPNIQKYQPKKALKMTQKKSIAWMCKFCQNTNQLDKHIQHCPAFYDGKEGCPIHPFRMGKDYWSEKTLTEEHKNKLIEARKKYMQEKA